MLAFPFALLARCEESHNGRIPALAPALLDGPQVLIDLHFIKGLLPVFTVSLFEAGGVLMLATLDVVAEAAVEQGAVDFEERQFFVEIRGIQTGVLGTPQPLQAANSLVNAPVHQKNRFIEMSLLHVNLLYGLRRNAAVRQLIEKRRARRIQLDGTTAGDVRRAEGRSARGKRNRDGRVAPKGRTRYFLFQPSLPLNQATLVRGASGADNTSASRLLPESTAHIADLYEKRCWYKNYRKYDVSVKGQVATKSSVHSRIGT